MLNKSSAKHKFDADTFRIQPMFSCILCSNKSFEVYKHSIRDATDIDAVKCHKCGHIQLYPLLSNEETREYYNKDKKMKEILPKVGNKIIERNAVWTDQQVERYLPFIKQSSNTLEIGSGYGLFLKSIKDNLGLNIDGIEISNDRRSFAQGYTSAQIHSVDLLTDEIPEDMKNKYDLIVSFHVLEHISNPRLFLQKVSDMLSMEGRIAFEVPNLYDAFQETCAPFYEFKWLQEHVSYFSKDSLYFLFETAGFTDIEIKGIQNYSLENHLYWMRYGKPNFKEMLLKHPDNLEWINKVYKEKLENDLCADSLLVIARKGIQN